MSGYKGQRVDGAKNSYSIRWDDLPKVGGFYSISRYILPDVNICPNNYHDQLLPIGSPKSLKVHLPISSMTSARAANNSRANLGAKIVKDF
jgi:hypothetical protein